MQGNELSEQGPVREVYIGIDVCKSHLDIHIDPHDEAFRVTNDRSGTASLVGRLIAIPIKLFVVEATGKWHRSVHRRLHEAGYDVAVVNQYRSRQLADAMGYFARIDAIDGGTLRCSAKHYGPARHHCRRPPSRHCANWSSHEGPASRSAGH